MIFLNRFFIMLSLLIFSIVANTQPPAASPELVVHLLDYLAEDYAGAVKDGKILSQGEYDEQVEFAKIVSVEAPV